MKLHNAGKNPFAIINNEIPHWEKSSKCKANTLYNKHLNRLTSLIFTGFEYLQVQFS